MPSLLVKQLPVFDGIERLLHDSYRYALSPEREPDPEIALLLYNDTVARDTARTSPVDRTMLAEAIRTADRAGAKSIGIDLFFAQPTPDEAPLIEALQTVRTPTYIVFADPEADGGVFWSAAIAGESRAYQEDFWRRIANPLVHRVSPMIGTDDANVARSWPLRREQSQVPMAAAMAGIDWKRFAYGGSIAFSRASDAEAGSFPSYSLSTITNPLLAESFAPQLAGRHVLIGLDIFNADRFATPITRIDGSEEIPGVAVHALMLRQALDREFPPPLPLWITLLLALLAALAGAASARLDRGPLLLAGLIAVQLALLAVLPVGLYHAGYDLLTMPISGWLLGWLLALAGFGYLARLRTSEERQFARGALGKYLPAAVAQQILADPARLALEGEERFLFMLFTDLEGFTRISHSQPATTTARVLNRYLDEMSEVILAHGGTIDKFVGDAIVAFWGAPIAGVDDGARAVACALALDACSNRLRARFEAEGERLGRTRIGLHCGQVVVGNFGGRTRIQYTALGDAMNTAARLEGANKYLESAILVSAAVREAAPDHAYLALGKIVLSGVDTPLAVFEPLPEPRRDYARRWQDAINAYVTGDDVAGDALRALAGEAGAGDAEAALVARLGEISGDKPYVLGSK